MSDSPKIALKAGQRLPGGRLPAPGGKKQVVRRRAATKGTPASPLPPLVDLWLPPPPDQEDSDASNQKVKAVVSTEQTNALKISAPVELDENLNPIHQVASREEQQKKLRQMNSGNGRKERRRRASSAQDGSRLHRKTRMESNFSKTMSRTKKMSDPSPAHGDKTGRLPNGFYYDLDMYNSTQSRGMMTKDKEVRMIPHPCCPEDSERWENYRLGALVEVEIPPETLIDFDDDDEEENLDPDDILLPNFIGEVQAPDAPPRSRLNYVEEGPPVVPPRVNQSPPPPRRRVKIRKEPSYDPPPNLQAPPLPPKIAALPSDYEDILRPGLHDDTGSLQL